MRNKLSSISLTTCLLAVISSSYIQLIDFANASHPPYRGPMAGRGSGAAMHEQFGAMVVTMHHLNDEIDMILNNMSNPEKKKDMEVLMNNINTLSIQMNNHMQGMQNPMKKEMMQSMINSLQTMHTELKAMLAHMSEPDLKEKLQNIREKLLLVQKDLNSLSTTPNRGRRFIPRS